MYLGALSRLCALFVARYYEIAILNYEFKLEDFIIIYCELNEKVI